MSKTIHPGEFLVERLINRGMMQSELSHTSGIRRGRVSELISGKRRITPAIALKLEKAFPSIPADVWVEMQAQWDLSEARKSQDGP